MEEIIYGVAGSPFGDMVLAKSKKGLCWLGFTRHYRRGDGVAVMKARFVRAVFTRADEEICGLAREILAGWEGKDISSIPLDLRGTDFQKKVWQALLNIKKGDIRTYSDIAREIKNPKAVRAVGSAVGANPVSLLVPCHRVVPASGGAVGNYAWGRGIKERLIALEAC